MFMRSKLFICVSALSAIALVGHGANASFIEDFDGGGTGPAWHLENTTGTAASLMNGGETGDFVRLANLDGGNNNSIAFDQHPETTGPSPDGIKLAFDFRMTDDQANADAGGCCDSAADGLGVGIFATGEGAYPATGAFNPTTAVADTIWERPVFPAAFTIGLDIFQNIDEVVVAYDGNQIASDSVAPDLDLNNNRFHRAIVDIKPNGGDSLVDVTIIADIHGPSTIHTIYSDLAVPGLDLANLPNYRLIAGGRTGGAFVAGDMDNFALEAVPEPASFALLGMACLFLLGRRR